MKKSEIVDSAAELVQDNSGPMRALLGRWFNIVLDDIASRGYLESLKREERATLGIGQREYELGSGTDKVYKVFVPAWGNPGGILIKANDGEYLARLLDDGTTGTGRPEIYSIFGTKTLRLHPPASADYAPVTPTTDQKLHIWKYRDIAHLEEGDDITEIKVKHTPTLLYGAWAFGARFDSMLDMANAEQKYERGVRRIFADDAMDFDRASQVKYRDLG